MVKHKSEKSELKAVIPHCTTYVGHKDPICFQLCIYVKQTVTYPSRCTPIPQLPLEKTWGWGWGRKGHLGCIRTAWTFKCNYIFHCIIKKKCEPFIVPLRLLRVCYMHVLARPLLFYPSDEGTMGFQPLCTGASREWGGGVKL